jgi:hypothetical protein
VGDTVISPRHVDDLSSLGGAFADATGINEREQIADLG